MRPPNIILPALHPREFGIPWPTPDGVRMRDDRILSDLHVQALLGIGCIPDRVMNNLLPAAMVALTKLRCEIAGYLFCGAPRPEAPLCMAPEALNAGGGGWWPAQAGPYGVVNGKLPEFTFTLSVPAL